ncbi:hypothetical protein [Ruminococcus sp. NK3A76]|uniref:hypothetical protein n=1 Tax=Ruminococcus sp. NK3A76 TaxID=877411 RepID=UPI00048D15CA|nr:hypothetical protein [Ruminococcus sp. NK3A76]
MLKAVYPVLGKQTVLPFYVSGIGICVPEYYVSRPQGLVSHQFLITASGCGRLKATPHEDCAQIAQSAFSSDCTDFPKEYYRISRKKCVI